ncbi:hypothetical protein GN956_G2520 [Arapaima gigas]
MEGRDHRRRTSPPLHVTPEWQTTKFCTGLSLKELASTEHEKPPLHGPPTPHNFRVALWEWQRGILGMEMVELQLQVGYGQTADTLDVVGIIGTGTSQWPKENWSRTHTKTERLRPRCKDMKLDNTEDMAGYSLSGVT